MNSDAARTKFPTIEYKVIGLRTNLQQVLRIAGIEQRYVFSVRHREWVMCGNRVAGIVKRFEQWEVDNPKELQATFGNGRAAKFKTKEAEHMANLGAIVGDQKKQIARLCSGGCNQPGEFVGGKELRDGRIEFAAVLDAHPHEALCAPALCLVGEFVELGASELGSPVDHDAFHTIGLEGVELGSGKVRCELDEFHAEADIGLI